VTFEPTGDLEGKRPHYLFTAAIDVGMHVVAYTVAAGVRANIGLPEVLFHYCSAGAPTIRVTAAVLRAGDPDALPGLDWPVVALM